MATEVMEVEAGAFNRKDYVFAMRKNFCPEEMVNQESGELMEEYVVSCRMPTCEM